MKPSPEEALKRVQAKAIRRRWRLGPPFDARIKRLVRDWGAQKSSALIEEMITTALKIARDEMTVADLKLINRSAKEMRSAAKIFAPFKHLRKVAVFGSARSADDSLNYKMATDLPAKWSDEASCLSPAAARDHGCRAAGRTRAQLCA